jgi:MinD-like ATPase involved in chromosome partitioning or flagellar assembly
LAKNDQDKGRSLEQQLASLDALSSEQDGPPDGGPPEQEAGEQRQEPPPQSSVPPNPWLNRPAEHAAPPESGSPAPPPFPPEGVAPYAPPSPYGPPVSPRTDGPAGEARQEVRWPDAGPPAAPGSPFYGQSPPPPGAQELSWSQPYSGPQAYAGRQPDAETHPHGPSPPPPYAAAPQSWESLSSSSLLRDRKQAPAAGWRRMVYKATAGVVHPGESPAELRRRELTARVCTPVAGGHHRVAVMSLKGGVGKTTTTVGLGATLASLRGDRVIAVDANPDRGTLSDKVWLETRATVRDLVNEQAQIQRYADVRAFTSQAPSRLEVLASDQDPAVSEAFSEDDYRTVTRVLEHYYSICLTDCGTGLLHSAMAGVLSLADQLVLVSSPSVDGARSASATLDWLQAHHYGDLVGRGVVVLSMVRSSSKSSVDLDRLQEHFEARCRSVVRVPYDSHLEEGAEVELDQLAAATRDAYLQLAATVGDGFAMPQ